MKPNHDPKVWAQEFKSFAEAQEMKPPEEISAAIFAQVRRDLNPRLSLVLAKLGGIHVVVGSLSLLLCSQFGMGYGDLMMRAFMGYGMPACMALCGALFLGLTSLIAGFLLSKHELKTIRRTAYAPVWLLGAMSLVVFWNFGAEIAVSWAAFWFIGAVVSGIAVTEGSIALRRNGRLSIAALKG